jgi:hypothetical protein
MKYSNWSEDEMTFLIENYPKNGTMYCVKKLGRTKRAVELRKQKLKLKFVGTNNRWKEENVIDAVKKSTNYTECLKNMGIHNFGSSSKTLKKYIKKYNLDISHFLSGEELLKQSTINRTKSLDDILIENSSYATTHLKNRLYKSGLKTRICELCGQNEDWKGKKMSLILDHINGINNDNRIENLRIVCPNCNATLDTHCRSSYQK